MSKNQRTNPRRTFGRSNNQYTRKAKSAAEKKAQQEAKIQIALEEEKRAVEHAEAIRILRETVAAESYNNPTVIRKHVVYPDGRQEYYDESWRLHCDTGPAVIPIDGPPEFWQHGELYYPQ